MVRSLFPLPSAPPVHLLPPPPPPGLFVDSAANLQLVPVWTMPPDLDLSTFPPQQVPWHDYWKGAKPHHGRTPAADIAEVGEGVSLVSLATRSYYHWVMEALGRLLVAQKEFQRREVGGVEAKGCGLASTASESSLRPSSRRACNTFSLAMTATTVSWSSSWSCCRSRSPPAA